MTLTLDKLLDVNTKIAKDMLMQTGEVRPMFVVQHGGEQTAIMTMWRDDNDKQVMLAALKLKMKELNADSYVSISEAWMANVDMKVNPEMMNIQPSKRNDRYEVIIVTANNHLDTRVSIQEILRDDNGKVTGTKDIPLPEKGGHFEGRMTDMLR